MAWCHRTSRETCRIGGFQPPKDTLNLGPGEYEGADSKQRPKEAKAPFWSKSPKIVDLKPSKMPGPGEYVLEQSWNAAGRFWTKADRFKNQQNKGDSVPPPGQYFKMTSYLKNNNQKRRKHFITSNEEIIEMFTSEKSIPTIPDGRPQLETTDSPRCQCRKSSARGLIPFGKQLSREALQKRTESSVPPPGAYFKLDIVSKKHAASASIFLSKTKRGFGDNSSQAFPGPGQYRNNACSSVRSLGQSKKPKPFESSAERFPIKAHHCEGPDFIDSRSAFSTFTFARKEVPFGSLQPKATSIPNEKGNADFFLVPGMAEEVIHKKGSKVPFQSSAPRFMKNNRIEENIQNESHPQRRSSRKPRVAATLRRMPIKNKLEKRCFDSQGNETTKFYEIDKVKSIAADLRRCKSKGLFSSGPERFKQRESGSELGPGSYDVGLHPKKSKSAPGFGRAPLPNQNRQIEDLTPGPGAYLFQQDTLTKTTFNLSILLQEESRSRGV